MILLPRVSVIVMGLFTRESGEDLSREYLRSAPPGQRKDILTFASFNAIATLPESSTKRYGRPVADGYGLEEASGIVRSVMCQDQALYAWVARGALVTLDALLENMSGSWAENLDSAMGAVGLDPGPTVREDMKATMPPAVQEDVVGLACYALSIFWVIAQPQSNRQRDRTMYDGLFTSTAPATRQSAYDIIAWAGIVIGRLRATGQVSDIPWFGPQYSRVPVMKQPGWYPNPYSRGEIQAGDASFQRYWDGEDWSDRIRLRNGRRWLDQNHSMHTPPSN